MLTALLKNGQPFVLSGNRLAFEHLLQLRKTEMFFCPVCKGPLELKLGSIKVYHFAHKRDSHCAWQGEPETERHLNGKRQLYEWLSGQDLRNVLLEPYLEEIKQRPDILAEDESRRLAIEYQCSLLNRSIFFKRTLSYLNAEIYPIWILGSNQLSRRSASAYRFSPFHWMCTCHDKESQDPFLLSYDPESQSFLRLTGLIPFTKTSVFANQQFFPLSKTSFLDLLSPVKQKLSVPDGWVQKVKQHRFSPYPHLSAESKNLRNLLYERKHLSLSSLPSAAFIPLSKGFLMDSPVFIWQTRVLLWLDNIPIHKPFHLNAICHHIQELIIKGRLSLKEIAQWQTVESFHKTIEEYLSCLTFLGMVTKTDHGTYIKTQAIHWRNNTENLLREDRVQFEKMKGKTLHIN
ncbi:competence protein CoiA family protein [Metabacillus sp. RGM 3146]|uniref:competence protein CoiA family protein n=1 Tax=Metabacillus sp. RGM 3146 TaxID=3401092 RepID=UPI003B99C25A